MALFLPLRDRTSRPGLLLSATLEAVAEQRAKRRSMTHLTLTLLAVSETRARRYWTAESFDKYTHMPYVHVDFHPGI